MITVYLGLTFSGPVLPRPPAAAIRELYVDYLGLLTYLERCYALTHPTANRDALRTEQYRQAVERHLENREREEPFYAASFAADRIATAEELLSRRDELLEAGYSLSRSATDDTPSRIRVLHEIEALVLDRDNDIDLMPGVADRLNILLAALLDRRHPRLKLYVHEPLALLPTGLRRLLDRLREGGDTIEQLPEPEAGTGTSDLTRWQRKLRLLLTGESDPETIAWTGDGSLVVLRAERETHIAAYLARTVKENEHWRPGVLMTVRNQTLDNAMLMEGLPSMGIPSTSLARPSLQVLKLVTAFLWEPVEVERIMEFVSLVTKPLERRLGQKLATHLADTPGLFGNRWTYAVEEAFRDMEARNYPPARIRRAREQYDFWFRRRRHPRDGRVPKAEVRSLFVFLRNWAIEAFDEDKNQSGLLVLSAQAERATELLDAQPETELSYLDVERLVRTVYQPAPTQFSPPEQGGLETSFAPASTAQLAGSGQPPLDRLVWWDFIESDPNYFFSRYYPEELAFLRERGSEPMSSEQRNQLLVWQNLRPLLHTRRQLILCLPRRVDGTEVEPHALLGDLEAACTEAALKTITVDIDECGTPVNLLTDLQLPGFAPVPIRELDPPVPHLDIARPQAMQPRDQETPTAVEDLLYYPHKWIFRHQLRLRGTPILSIASENRLRGNLSHLFVEQLLDDIAAAGRPFDRNEVEAWIDEHATRIFRQQGAVLLEYGQEPERVQFLLTMKKSAWTLVSLIQRNGWTIRGSEQEIGGELTAMGGQVVAGRADLVLDRVNHLGQAETAVVDLKWRGKTVFRNLLRNASDIQLCLYAEFLRQTGSARVHTAYYILRDAKMISRNELAFAGADVVADDTDFTVIQQETLARIRATHDWRWEQFADGTLEVRCKETVPFLEDLYLDLPHDSLLSMKDDTSPFDDYRSLIGLVR
ncbi:hypothetical protein GGR28_003670 [Lewinella aquimaris]|uniref:PD-(D/E)XK endonuclease-like domain-containing protein n=1 Tax=Neolewinella aquimaris TaxID=1835722 RepID=A0A840EGU9_9BACT|nr:hypothetical protein [Neolewinella aquimaris]MBB4081029.1 hypothetical protein [Neolewinella aquimaris]